MKKLIFLSIFLFLSLLCQAQVVEFKTQVYSVSLFNNVEEKWDAWDEWELCEIRVTLDLDSALVKVYSQHFQRYEVLNATSGVENNRKTFTMECFDSFKEPCLLQMVYLHEIDAHHLYIVWGQLRIVYQMKKL